MKNKALLIVLVLSLILVSGCSIVTKTNIVTKRNVTVEENKNEEKKDKVIPVRKDGIITLSLAFSTSMQDPRAVASEMFKKEVEEKTKGTVKIDIYPDSELGSDATLISKVMSGQVDMTISSAGNFSGYVKNQGVSALPFMFESFEEAWLFMDSEIIRSIDEELLPFNIRVLSHFDNGFRCITTTDIPINEPQNLENLKIRVPDNAILKETMSQLGARPVSLDFAELKPALKNGEFDAQENPIPVIYNNGIYEVQKYLSVTNHSYDAMPLVISDVAWQMLTKEEQNIINNAAQNAQSLNRNLVKEQTEQYVSKLENECGMSIIYPNVSKFKELTEGVAYFFCYDEQLLEQIDEFTNKNMK